MSYLFENILSCKVCLENFDLKTHKPFVLICGHNICQRYINECYDKANN